MFFVINFFLFFDNLLGFFLKKLEHIPVDFDLVLRHRSPPLREIILGARLIILKYLKYCKHFKCSSGPVPPFSIARELQRGHVSLERREGPRACAQIWIESQAICLTEFGYWKGGRTFRFRNCEGGKQLHRRILGECREGRFWELRGEGLAGFKATERTQRWL